jgi:hypothetical protein
MITGAATVGVGKSKFAAVLHYTPKHGKPITVGTVTSSSVGKGRHSFTIKLNAAGRAALRHARKLKVVLVITVTPPKGKPVTVKRTITISR